MSIWTDKNGRIHVGIMARGRRIHRILPKGQSKSDAKQLEADLRGAMGRQKNANIPGDPLLADIMGLYVAHADAALRSPDTARHHAARIGLWLEKYRASQSRQAAAHIIKDMTGHYAAGTINRSLGTLKKALKLAWEQGHIEADYSTHVRRLPENNARDTYLNLRQVQKLADSASEQVRAAIWIALLTGARRGEILKIRPEDIGKNTLIIHAGNTKTLRTRTVPIVPPLRPWLKHLPLAINAEGLKTGFRRARKAANMEHVNFHDLRHSCASILIASGADLYTVAKILGHASTRTTERYAHMEVKQQRAAMRKAFG